MPTRREFIAAAAALALAGCGPEQGSLTVSAQGSPGMNPGPDGADRPLTLTLIQMRGTGAFNGADVFALQDPQAALGGEFVSAQQLVVTPGSKPMATVVIESGVTAVGIVAGYRNPAGKVFRLVTPAPSGAAGVIVSVTAGGISMQSA